MEQRRREGPAVRPGTGGKRLDVQPKLLLRAVYGYYAPTRRGRWMVLLMDRESGKTRTAFLDPARIRGVYEIRDAKGRHAAILIDYDSSHQFYERFRVNEPSEDSIEAVARRIAGDGARVNEVRLLNIENYAEPCDEEGKYWRPYLPELGEYDSTCWSFHTTVKIITTNIHPYYGVMD